MNIFYEIENLESISRKVDFPLSFEDKKGI